MDIIDVLVWAGTATFAATGALVAVRKRFDLFGVLVLAAVTAVGGGAIRDVVVGRLPPSNLTNEGLLWLVAATAVLTYLLRSRLDPESDLLYAFDTIGLAVFAALGAERGLGADLGMWGTVFAGAISGVGGGIIRDLLSGEVPGILYRSGDLYASAAAIGAATVYWSAAIDPSIAMLAGTLVTVGVRVGSRVLGLQLPVPRGTA